MEQFRFHSPEYLILLLAVPFFYLLLEKLQNRASSELSRFVSKENLKQLLSAQVGVRSVAKKLALWLAMACFIVALARPQANPVIEERDQASLDIMILLDVSRSMDAEDLPPSRLKKAKKSIQHLLDELSGDRVGLLAFAGSAVLVSPLTSDYEIVKTFLQNIDTSIISNQGTDISAGLQVALAAMERGAESMGSDAPKSNIFILMSDGEDQFKADLSVVDKIHAKGGTIFSIAFGTEKGVPIPVRSEQGELSGYKRDRAGNPVLSKVQPETLREIAKLGGGQFYFSTLDEGEIMDILKRTQGIQRQGGAQTKAKIYQEYFYPLLFLGFLLLLPAIFPLTWLWQKARTLRFYKTALALIFLSSTAQANPLSFLWDKEKRASEHSLELAQNGKKDQAAESLKELQAENPDAPAVNYNIGTFLVEGKKYEEGRSQLERLLKPGTPLRSEAQYNIAGSYAEEGKKDEARKSYAELIRDLSIKEKLNDQEVSLLSAAKKNLARLASAEFQQQQNQKKDQSGEEGEKGEKKDQKDQDKKDQDKKDKDSKDERKKDKKEEKKEEKKLDDKGDSQQNKSEENAPPPPRGRQPFKERDNMGEDEAKKVLEALKQQELTLQKKFLKKKEGGKGDGNGKDW